VATVISSRGVSIKLDTYCTTRIQAEMGCIGEYKLHVSTFATLHTEVTEVQPL